MRGAPLDWQEHPAFYQHLTEATMSNHEQQPVVTIETVSPATAQIWLEQSLHDHNRPVNQAWVTQLASFMMVGDFVLSNDAITFRGKRLENGQNRLHAVVQSGVTCRFLVMRHAPELLFQVADTGKGRTLVDLLKINNHKYAPVLARAGRLYTFWIRADKKLTSHNHFGLSAGKRPSLQQVLRVIEREPQLARSVDTVMKHALRLSFGGISVGTLSFVHAAWTLHGYESEIDEFVEQLGSGIQLHSHFPSYQMRERFVRVKNSKTETLSAPARVALVVYASNLHVHGRVVTYLNPWQGSWPQFDFSGRVMKRREETNNSSTRHKRSNFRNGTADASPPVPSVSSIS